MFFSFIILAILLISLIGARAVIAAHLQGITYLITGHRRLGLIIYSLLFLPGIIIHELSHFFMAGLLGVQTGEITIFPSGTIETGEKSLGSVQIAKTDVIRSSLIGIAPLIMGSLSIITLTKWQFPELLNSLIAIDGVLNQLLVEGGEVLSIPMNFIWIYLIFAISNTMFVSEADRRSWPAMALLLIIIGSISMWAGISQSVLIAISEPLGIGINILSAAFIVTLIIDVIFMALVLLIESITSKILNKRVRYRPSL